MRVVQAAVERAGIRRSRWAHRLERQIGDRLAKIAVVVDHLFHGKAVLQQLAPVERRGQCPFRTGRAAAARRPGNLAASHGLEVCFHSSVLISWSRNSGIPCSSSAGVGFGVGRCGDLQAAALDQLRAIIG